MPEVTALAIKGPRIGPRHGGSHRTSVAARLGIGMVGGWVRVATRAVRLALSV